MRLLEVISFFRLGQKTEIAHIGVDNQLLSVLFFLVFSGAFPVAEMGESGLEIEFW